jgi:hypothetical protein
MAAVTTPKNVLQEWAPVYFILWLQDTQMSKMKKIVNLFFFDL